MHSDQRGFHQRFDVVADRRLIQITVRCGIGRAHARHGALAFERFDQCAFFAGDIGACAEMDFDIETEVLPENALADQVFGAAARQH